MSDSTYELVHKQQSNCKRNSTKGVQQKNFVDFELTDIVFTKRVNGP